MRNANDRGSQSLDTTFRDPTSAKIHIHILQILPRVHWASRFQVLTIGPPTHVKDKRFGPVHVIIAAVKLFYFILFNFWVQSNNSAIQQHHSPCTNPSNSTCDHPV